jgi:hypoxanthine phosphoribosyltransferase
LKKHKDIEKVLFSPVRIQRKVRDLARRISRDYAQKDLVVVCVLKGSVVFSADLIRALDVPCAVDFISVASYGDSARSSGVPRILLDLRQSPEGKDILIAEDILDTGLTLQLLLRTLKSRKARSVRVCALLDKPANRKVSVRADYRGFRVPDRFVVGYGLDYREKYRHLPYIGSLKKEVLIEE